MTRVSRWARHFVTDEQAATMPEYALMIALIAVVCIAAVTLIGTAASGKFQSIQAAISGG